MPKINLEGIKKDAEEASKKIEEAKHKAEEIKAQAEKIKAKVEERVDEKDKKIIKDHAVNTVANTVKQPLQVVNTTGAIANSPEAHLAAKLIGGEEGVQNLEKAQAVLNKTNTKIDKVANVVAQKVIS